MTKDFQDVSFFRGEANGRGERFYGQESLTANLGADGSCLDGVARMVLELLLLALVVLELLLLAWMVSK